MPRFTTFSRAVLLLCCTPCFWPAAPLLAQPSGQVRTTLAENAPPVIREMQAVEDRWSNAVTKRDQYSLELLLSPQFIGISSTGDVTTRDQQISSLFVENAEPSGLQQKVISVRSVGDIAIVNGTYVKHWKLDKGPLDEKGIYSHVFLYGRTGWVCLNSQRTVVSESGPETAPAKTAAKQKSGSSNASLPLHIPLIYKGHPTTQPQPAPGADEPPS